MAKYKITFDTTLYRHAFEEIVVEAETSSKAKYKASKFVCDFSTFIKTFNPSVEKISDDTPLTINYWVEKRRLEPNETVLEEKDIYNTTFCLISKKSLEEQ